jgi:hypothetical protein
MGAFNDSVSSYSNQHWESNLHFFDLLVNTLAQQIASINRVIRQDGITDQIGVCLISSKQPKYQDDSKEVKEFSTDRVLIYRDIPLCAVFIAYNISPSNGPTGVNLFPTYQMSKQPKVPKLLSESDAKIREKMAAAKVASGTTTEVEEVTTRPGYSEGLWTIVIRDGGDAGSQDGITVFQGTPMEFSKIDRAFDFLADLVILRRPAT